MRIALALGCLPASPADADEWVERTIESNRRLEVLAAAAGDAERRAQLARAGRELGDWRIELAGRGIDGPLLVELASRSPDEPLVRVARERLRLPVDVDDLLLFLDDLLREGRAGRRGELVFLTPGRARGAGILLHADDVFGGSGPRRYGTRPRLSIEQPRPQPDLLPPPDGALLGPAWAARYPNPRDERARLDALDALARQTAFAARVESLLRQLREQGADVFLTSTVRRRERGYLMWGAFVLSRATGESELLRRLKRVEAANRDWRLEVPIRWRHPDGWRATREAAREMAETYEVVYATEAGARDSSHYEGRAADCVAIGLPRRLSLEAPDGASRSFDLSGADEPRDLGLTPALIDWIEPHFGLRKLRSDHPHWDDALARPRGGREAGDSRATAPR